MRRRAAASEPPAHHYQQQLFCFWPSRCSFGARLHDPTGLARRLNQKSVRGCLSRGRPIGFGPSDDDDDEIGEIGETGETNVTKPPPIRLIRKCAGEYSQVPSNSIDLRDWKSSGQSEIQIGRQLK